MVTPELLEYIKSEARRGVHKESIKFALLNKRWLLEDVKAAFLYLYPEKRSIEKPKLVVRQTQSGAYEYKTFIIKHETLKVFLREIFGLIWLIDAYYKWQPSFPFQFSSLLKDASTNQLPILKTWYDFWITLSSSHLEFLTYSVALSESYFALALILGFAGKTTYVLGALFSLMVWSLGEGFGGLHEANPIDLGAAVMYSLMFLALFTLNYYSGSSEFSLDALIEKRFPLWRKIAES